MIKNEKCRWAYIYTLKINLKKQHEKLNLISFEFKNLKNTLPRNNHSTLKIVIEGFQCFSSP